MNLDNLTPITKNSVRGSNQKFDLHLNADDNKFTVSDSLYATLHLNKNGFTAYVGDDAVFLAVLPNEEAVSYKGREGSEKGKVFTSTEMSKAFDKFGLTGSLSLEEEGTKDDVTYYRVSSMEQASEEVVAEDTDDEEIETELEEENEEIV